MTYYEELGLRHDATTPEIRQAYKVLARLVHPDGQSDEQLRAMAERQMKRLNEILAILIDAQRRREYDATLPSLPAALGGGMDSSGLNASSAGMWRKRPVSLKTQVEPWWTNMPEWVRSAGRYWYWVSLGLVILCVGFWYVAQGKPGSVATPLAVRSRPLEDVAPVEPQARRTVRTTQPDKAHADTGGMKETVAPAGDEPGREGHAMPATEEVRGRPATPVEAPIAEGVIAKPERPTGLARGAPLGASPFAGDWLSVPEVDKGQPGSYPATYAEFLLSEEHGEVSGSYRAEYRVRDLAVSPEVSFRVRGVASADKVVKLRWTSTDGATGEVEVMLLEPDLMRLTWWTTRHGRRAVLGAGSAKLMRQRTR